MGENEFLEQVIVNAVRSGTIHTTAFQQHIAHLLVGELDGTTPGVVKDAVRQEIGRRATTLRHTTHTIPTR